MKFQSPVVYVLLTCFVSIAMVLFVAFGGKDSASMKNAFDGRQVEDRSRIASFGDPKRISKNAPKDVNGIHRIALASIPRTGNGWIRGLIEGATGVASESIFKEGPASHFNERSGGYGKRCGWLEDCSLVGHSVGIHPVVIKTHFPFTSHENSEELLKENKNDVGDVSYIIAPARNPLDNYEAWDRYQTDRLDEKTWKHTTLKEFVRAWAEHHEYWYGLGVPMFVYRYEDLVDNPIAILKELLKATAMWDFFQLTDVNLMRVATVDRLQAYKRKQFGAPTKQKDDLAHNWSKYNVEDIQWVLDNYRPLLERLGYAQLYNVWLAAHGGDMSEEDITRKVQKVMRNTALSGNWGDQFVISDSYFDV
eukprot:m.241256 g.241256  ORF g.241256 m.241256 type:complete len:364 (-) comp19463_c0_seq1:1112-2203(-)